MNIKKNISNDKKTIIKLFICRIKAFFFHHNLTYLAKIFKTDKWGAHYYTKHYQHHFRPFKNKKNVVFEIGVGGYDNPKNGGHSLRMWKYYFRNSKIVSIDIYDKSPLEENRIKIYKGSQTDDVILNKIYNDCGKFDIIIDDGSHINEHVICTFNSLFPKLKNGGVYVIEDTQTSYWPDMGGELKDKNNKETIYGFFKSLIDGLNYKEFTLTDYIPNYYDLNIVSMHFYHNLIFIYKGENMEKSNVVKNGKRKF